MKKVFDDLVTSLCALMGLGNSRSYIEGTPFNVNGSMCTLIYDGQIDPDQFFLYVVFGYPPHDKEAQAFESMLQQNHLEFEGKGPGFCISANSGKIGHVASVRLDETNPDQLAKSLAYYAGKAAEWRKTFSKKRTDCFAKTEAQRCGQQNCLTYSCAEH